MADLIDVVEAAYRVTLPEAEWMEGVLEACAPHLPLEMGVYAYLFDASGASLRSSTWRSLPRAPAVEEAMRVMVEAVPREYVERTWLGTPFGCASDISGSAEILDSADAPYRDVLAINGVDPTGHGIWLGGPLANRQAVTAEMAVQWTKIAAHLASAYRVRRQLEGTADPIAGATAVLAADGAVVHAEHDARAESARAKLRDAVIGMDRARTTKERQEPHAALSQWRGLVDAEWTLIDCFDADGRRFVVARTNRPYAGKMATLSAREIQALALVALGHAPKVAAYELGLAEATVRVLLMRAVRKLGVRTRAEAITLFRAYAH